MAWYQKTSGDVLLRIAGLGILAVAWLAGAALHSRVGAGSLDRDALAWLFAVTTFLCGSAGAILVAIGRHIFDRVAVSRRWRRVRRA